MKRILLAVTPSPSSHLALNEAIKLATRSGARLCLIRVVHASLAETARGGDWFDRMEEQIPHELSDGAVAFRGSPPQTLFRAAEAYHADILMLGARVYGALLRLAGNDDAYLKRMGPKLLIVREEAKSGDAATAISTRAPLHGRHDHVLFEATALAGAATGALTGAIAGPPGIFIGGAVGAAIGLLAGSALERADKQTTQHDHLLDDVIGVTHGSIGLDAPGSHANRDERDEPLAAAGQLLGRDHQRLDSIYGALMAAHQEGDWREVRAEWELFEPAIRDHMLREETMVFPAFREINPRKAAVLLAEHVELRGLLDKVAIGIELHAIGASQLELLVERLRTHGAREEALLYPWMDVSLAGASRKTLAA